MDIFVADEVPQGFFGSKRGQRIRQAEQAEVSALLERDDLATLTPQLIPPQQPRRRAAWPAEVHAAVDAALIWSGDSRSSPKRTKMCKVDNSPTNS